MGCGGSKQRTTDDGLTPSAWGRPTTAGPKTTFKLVLLGAHFVGKTCISLRYCRGWTNLNELPTVGASFYAKNLDVNGTTIKFENWDTAGQERYASLAPMYYRGADGAVLVYDITNADSFEAMKKWDAEISASVPEAAKLIIGSKIDLVGSRQVPSDIVQAYSEERNIPHCLASAKTGEGIEEAFLQMANMIIANQQSSLGTLSR